MAYKPANPNGQATMANSDPVVIASNQSAIPISGTVAANATLSAETTKVIGTVNVAGTVPISGALTDTQIRATPLPVTMSNTLALTDTQIRATPLPVSGTFFQTTQPVSLFTNTPDVTDRSGRLLGTIANTSFTVNAGTNLNTSALALDTTLIGGTLKAIARGGAKGTTVAGDITSTNIDTNTQALDVNIKSTVSISNFPQPQPVTGTFFQATQPVSIATTVPVTGTFFQATQPVSATVLPLPTGAAQDGTDITTPFAMLSGGLGIRGWLSSIWTKLNGSLAVTGTFFQTTQPVSLVTNTPTLQAGSTTAVTQATAANLNATVVGNGTFATQISAALPTGTNSIGSVTGTFFQTTQPVSIATTLATDPSDRATRQLGIASVKPVIIAPQSTPFAAAAVGSTVGYDVSAAANITFIIKNTIAATAWTGTPVIVFEQSDDNVSWALLGVVRNDTNLSSSTHTLPANAANTEYMFDTAAEGPSFARARVTVGTATGGMTIVVQPGSFPFSPVVTSILNPETTKVIGTVNLPSPAITYSSVATGVVPAATATDLVTIYGSATKTINILNIMVTGVQTTAGQAQILLIKRSTANTAGTSTAQTRIPYDSNDVAATATVLAYTANPTLGTAIGNVRGDRAFLPGAASASDAQGLAWSFINGKPMILRGVTQGICINLAGATLAGGSINVTIEWTES